MLCSHWKSQRHPRLSKQIPKMKKILEMALIRIKQMLEANNCQSAFWVGNLKHRDLDGKEICSQVPIVLEEAEPNSKRPAQDDLYDADDDDDELSSMAAEEEEQEKTLALSL